MMQETKAPLSLFAQVGHIRVSPNDRHPSDYEAFLHHTSMLATTTAVLEGS